MSEMRDGQPDDEQRAPNENQPTEDGNAFQVPQVEENKDGLPRMRLGELREAAADPEHPRHEEACEIEQRMAASISKSISKLDMSDQIKRLTDSITPLKAMTPIDLKGLYPTIGIKVPDLKVVMPEMRTPDYLRPDSLPKLEALVQPAVDTSWHEEVTKKIAERKAAEEERELATLQFMQRVAEGIEAQNVQLKESALVDKKRYKVNLRLVVWTLIVSTGSFLASLGMPFFLRWLSLN